MKTFILRFILNCQTFFNFNNTMKKFLTLVLGCFLGISLVFAQKDPSKVEKNAKDSKPLSRANKQLLNEEWEAALKSADDGLNDPKTKEKDKASFYLVKAGVYDSLAFRTEDDAKLRDYIQNAKTNYEKVISVMGLKEFLKLDKESYFQMAVSNDTITPLVKMNRRFLNKGVNFYNSQDYANSFKWLEYASIANPKDTTTLIYGMQIGRIVEPPNFPKILAMGEQLLKNNYKQPMVYEIMSFILKEENKDYDKALAIIKEGRKLYPSNKTLSLQEVDIYIKTNRLQEAITNLETAANADPKNSPLWSNLGILHEQAGNPDKAEPYYKKAIEADPTNYDAVYSMGAFHYNKGFKLVKEAANMDLKVYEKDGKKLEDQAKVHFQDALPYFEKAYALKKDDKQLLGGLQSIYRNLQDAKKLEEITKALEKLGE